MNLSFLEEITFNGFVTPSREIGRTEIGGNQEVAENAVKSRVSEIEGFPKISREFPKNAVFFPKTIFGKKLGEIWGKQRNDKRLGNTVAKRNERIVKLLNGVAS